MVGAGIIVTALYIAVAPRPRAPVEGARTSSRRAQWWPDWHSPQLWLLGIALGANNALFFAANVLHS